MKKVAFSQQEIIGNVHPTKQDKVWVKFTHTCNQLGFKVRVTGGNFITHELMGANQSDLDTIKELVKGL